MEAGVESGQIEAEVDARQPEARVRGGNLCIKRVS